MPTTSDYRSETFIGTFGEATGSLLRMAGGWGNVNGPSYFMLRVLLSGSVSAAIMGLAGAAISASFIGTAGLPFLIAACGGFIFGATGFYRDAMRQSLAYLERYPRLLQLHLDANFPTQGFLRYREDQLRASVFSSSWTLRSMLMCSWLTARPALDQILEDREQAIVEGYRSEAARSSLTKTDE